MLKVLSVSYDHLGFIQSLTITLEKLFDTSTERNMPEIKVFLNCCIKKRLHRHIKN